MVKAESRKQKHIMKTITKPTTSHTSKTSVKPPVATAHPNPPLPQKTETVNPVAPTMAPQPTAQPEASPATHFQPGVNDPQGVRGQG